MEFKKDAENGNKACHSVGEYEETKLSLGSSCAF